MEKWNDNVWFTKNENELEDLYTLMCKYDDYDAMEELEFYAENGLFYEE